jgi:hypothetical protein
MMPGYAGTGLLAGPWLVSPRVDEEAEPARSPAATWQAHAQPEGWWTRVNQIELAKQHLLGADSMPSLLAAGWEAFELVMAVAAASADQCPDMYPALTLARGSAVSGRNAIAFAPSMPDGYAAPLDNPVPGTGDVYEVADAVAGLASVLSARLRDAAGLAADAGDRAACEDAARYAEQIGKLLGGGE